MFHVHIEVRKSPIHGNGVFTTEHIHRGQLVYNSEPGELVTISQEELIALPAANQLEVRHFGYLDKHDKRWRLATDNIRFCNHSTDGNLTAKAGVLIAKRDIIIGEELTQDYREFEELRDRLR